jgi:hypothetical protein
MIRKIALHGSPSRKSTVPFAYSEMAESAMSRSSAPAGKRARRGWGFSVSVLTSGKPGAGEAEGGELSVELALCLALETETFVLVPLILSQPNITILYSITAAKAQMDGCGIMRGTILPRVGSVWSVGES